MIKPNSSIENNNINTKYACTQRRRFPFFFSLSFFYSSPHRHSNYSLCNIYCWILLFFYRPKRDARTSSSSFLSLPLSDQGGVQRTLSFSHHAPATVCVLHQYTLVYCSQQRNRESFSRCRCPWENSRTSQCR